jgi:hypothetical protein
LQTTRADTYGENLGRTLVRRKVAQWKSEKVAKGRMVMLMGLEMSLGSASGGGSSGRQQSRWRLPHVVLAAGVEGCCERGAIAAIDTTASCGRSRCACAAR